MPQIESLGLYCLFKNEVYDHELHWEDSKLKVCFTSFYLLFTLNLTILEANRLGARQRWKNSTNCKISQI
jgi:hypothetical protein